MTNHSMPPLVITFAPNASPEDWKRAMAIVQLLPGVRLVEAAPPAPVQHVGGRVHQTHPKGQKRPEFWVMNTMGVCIATRRRELVTISRLDRVVSTRAQVRDRADPGVLVLDVSEARTGTG